MPSSTSLRQPTAASPDSAGTGWAPFLVDQHAERLQLLRNLRDNSAMISLTAPGGVTLNTSLWTVDTDAERLNFNVDAESPQLQALLETDEAVAVAYQESVKLQFDLEQLVLVRGAKASALQCKLPQQMYRFQRRGSYRIAAQTNQAPQARLRHPAMPDIQLSLRVLDVSIGGCSLWLPHDLPTLQAGTELARVAVQLDSNTAFSAAITVQYISALSQAEGATHGVRLGCAWEPLTAGGKRQLQGWVDQIQRRQRMLSLG